MTRPATSPQRRSDAGRDPRRARPGRPADRPPPRSGRPGQRPDRPAPPVYEPAYDLVRLRSPDLPLRARIDPVGGRAGPDPRDRRPGPAGRRRGWLARFVRTHGWRAYALPVLVVATFVTVLDAAGGDPATRGGQPDRAVDGGPGGGAAGDPRAGAARDDPAARDGRAAGAPAPRRGGIFVDSPTADAGALPSTALPRGGPFASRGDGRFAVVRGTSGLLGTGGPVLRFTVEVEGGVRGDGVAFARAVERTLGDPRSWGNAGRLRFQRVDSGPVDFRVSRTAALTVRRLCGYTLPYETSCYNGDLGRAVINDARWVRGAVAYADDLAAYRNYVVNHEVGHALGRGHQTCPRAGARAPLMMQQTLGLQTPGVGSCRANPWPYP